jgi:CheY-like chemotaxis protein
MLNFSVQDTGIGIAEDKLETIFESFTQAEASTTRKYGGTGLGLAITRKLLKMHNSRINVVSKPGEGSTFSFTIEYKIEEPNTEIMIPSTSVDGMLEAENIHLLLIEDNPLNRFVTEKFLTRWGISFSVAETGNEALKLLEKEVFNLVLMDLQLPDIDGYEITRRLRTGNTTNKHVPVMAMSASTEPHIQAKAFAAGMQEYLIKPFNPDNFRQRIQQLAVATDINKLKI